ncbi:prepilin-type N-terminal cleavage/methylation domain-containing protein [Moraxella haemolytica]|uniref:type IV pilus modification PilV family protein n=1 Tax=Moraxella TaxID=475 RepID=UPI0025427C5B|nr:prepilin-type N-terminal cleavage/methylation domain-containing protein [Moraxella sp. ZY171148]WII94818.1 prepilin-type N-terminal cleavage/methylation domain-containing protein [Moraxella sp. ZY171148]
MAVLSFRTFKFYDHLSQYGLSMGLERMQKESGFGLIEVMVALLLVSMVFFGFLSVQMRAYHTSQDAAIRTHAVSLLGNQAQILQGHDESVGRAYEALFAQLNRNLGDVSGQMMSNYRQALDTLNTHCHQRVCTPEESVKYQAVQSAKVAATHGVRMNVLPCPDGRCLVAVWGETKAIKGEQGCMNKAGGINAGAKCVMMVVH